MRFHKLVWADSLFLLALCGFAYVRSGPAAVVTLAGAAVHYFNGQPRLHFFLPYALLLAAVLPAYVRKGLHNWLPEWLGPTSYAVLTAVAVVTTVVFQQLLPTTQQLPQTSGPHDVACAVTEITSHKRGTNFMLRVYYPTPKAVSTEDEADSSAREPLPYFRLGTTTAAGFARFVHFPSFLFNWACYIPSGMWAGDVHDAPVSARKAPHAEGAAAAAAAGGAAGKGKQPSPSQAASADKEKLKQLLQSLNVSTTDTAAADDDEEEEALPVAIFSHGLGGTPDCYSNVIAELASHGYVVLCPEHADGSAAVTAFRDGTVREHSFLTKEELADLNRLAYKKRKRQLQQRSQELSTCLDVVEMLAGTRDAELHEREVQKQAQREREAQAGRKGSSSSVEKRKGNSSISSPAVEEEPVFPYGLEEDDRDILQLKALLYGRVRAAGTVLLGHSFGAASIMSTASRDSRPYALVALDPWMFPLPVELLRKGLGHLPTLAVSGDGFTHWPDNTVTLRKLLHSSSEEVVEGAAGAAGGAAASKQQKEKGKGKEKRDAKLQKELLQSLAETEQLKKGSESSAGQADSYSSSESEDEGSNRRGRDRGSAAAGASEDKDTSVFYYAKDFSVEILEARGSSSSTSSPISSTTSAAVGASSSSTQQHQQQQGGRHPQQYHPLGQCHPQSALVTVEGAEHQSFTDFCLLMEKPAQWLGMIGPADSLPLVKTIRSLTVHFVELQQQRLAAEKREGEREKEKQRTAAGSRSSSSSSAPASSTSPAPAGYQLPAHFCVQKVDGQRAPLSVKESRQRVLQRQRQWKKQHKDIAALPSFPIVREWDHEWPPLHADAAASTSR